MKNKIVMLLLSLTLLTTALSGCNLDRDNSGDMTASKRPISKRSNA